MNPIPLDLVGTRTALSRLPDVAAQENLDPPPLARVYVPSGHHKALSLETSVVVGMRGAGKSLWTAVLLSDNHRRFVAARTGNAQLAEAVVRVGFGLDDTNEHFPNAAALRQIVEGGVDPMVVWKAVVLRHTLAAAGIANPMTATSWQARCAWTAGNPEEADRLLTASDHQLAQHKRVVLVLFDALDRLASSWAGVRALTEGALRFALACRSRRAIRLKLFLRPDMEEDAEIWRFQDSSKLRHSKVELSWRPAELYGLVLTHLANDEPFGAAFRASIASHFADQWSYDDLWEGQEGVFAVPRNLTMNDTSLRTVVDAIAAPWMGRSAKRGFTFTWIPIHLADAIGRISPRSFLLAFKRAAAVTEAQYEHHNWALHYEAIQQGVAEASRIRIEEIKEDYPWVEPLLEAARGLVVPCSPEELIERWSAQSISDVKSANRKLPPRRFTTDPNRTGQPDALVDDLVELAVLYRTEDGRLNMPDIFRVGFGIKRKGGVKPLK